MASEVVRDGCLAINKPRGMSSAQVIRDCQTAWNDSAFFKPLIQSEIAKRKQEGGQIKRKQMRRAAQVKIGHGGTLDPLATGILILGIGSATKALPQFLDCKKTYEATIVFGASTDTYDRVGRILTKRPYEHITREKVEEALGSFRGKQTQIPPLYSALKMNGKPLYEYAREGKAIPREIEGREVEVKELEIIEWYEPGKHRHFWPKEEAEAVERSFAEQVWAVQKAQQGSKKLTPEEKVASDKAAAAHETFKRQSEERQDGLIKDRPTKKSKQGKDAMMSGALGQLPESNKGPKRKGADLIPEALEYDESTPPPWKDEGPPACKIRMTVSSGYYVRSFCHDLGAKLDSAGLMAELSRIRQSDFTVGGVNCLEYDVLAKGEDVWGPQVADMLARWNGEPSSEWEATNSKEPKDKSKAESASEQDAKIQQDARDKVAAQGKEILEKAEKELARSRSASPSKSTKRRLSPSADGEKMGPPRKVQARSPERSGKGNDDDEKSWSGIED